MQEDMRMLLRIPCLDVGVVPVSAARSFGLEWDVLTPWIDYGALLDFTHSNGELDQKTYLVQDAFCSAEQAIQGACLLAFKDGLARRLLPTKMRAYIAKSTPSLRGTLIAFVYSSRSQPS